MQKHKTLIPPLCLALLCSIGEAQELMELHVSSRPTNQSSMSLDCNISSAGPLIIKHWAWLDPNGTELCKINDSQTVSSPCEYVPQKRLTLSLETDKLKNTSNYTCRILSNRGIKSAKVEVKMDPMPGTDAQNRSPEPMPGTDPQNRCPEPMPRTDPQNRCPEPMPGPELILGGTSSSVCGPGLAWVGLLVTLLMM